MSPAEFIAQSSEDLHNFTEFCWKQMNFPVKISYKSFEGMRTISQNALFHMWCQETAQFFVKNGKMTFADGSEMIKENVKRNLKQTFLGEELVESVNLKTGEITQRMELRHTSKLEKGEMHHFMTQIVCGS
jgi:hypothetical protein